MKKQESAADIAGKAEKAAWRARERARVARWDVNLVIFLFAILITILLLLFQGFGTEVVAPIGFVGLALVWFVGWKRGRQLYEYFYYEELSKLEEEKKETTKEEIIHLMGLVAQSASERKKERDWGIPRWRRVTHRAISIAIVSLLAIFIGGISFAFAQPEHTVATPFRGVAITTLKASSEATGLIEDIRRVVASYERNIVYTSLQSMRVMEGLRDVPAVTVPTNDMTRFPSPEHPLFPEYLDKKFSQFHYTVDSDGIVILHISGATADSFLEKIKQLLNRLAEAE